MSSRTFTSLYGTPKWFKIWATVAENPHWGMVFEPFMKSTTSFEATVFAIQS